MHKLFKFLGDKNMLIPLRSKTTIFAFHQDTQKNIWLGVRYNGLGVLYGNKAFVNYSNHSLNEIELSKDIVNAIYYMNYY